jgi:hypothetical protein
MLLLLKIYKVNFKNYYHLKESRWSDSEYRNPSAPWRLTPEEYLSLTNKSSKIHPSSAYEPSEKKIIDSIGNPILSVDIFDSSQKGWKKICWTHQNGESECQDRVSPLEISTEKDAKNYALLQSPYSDISWKTVKPYFWEDSSPLYNPSSYPYKIETLSNGLTIKYKKKPYLEIAIFEENKPVAIAFEEWGALLIQVSLPYRNSGLGKILSRLWNSIQPTDSGGFTPQGLSMKKSLHRDAVKQAQEKGWYEKALKDGILPPEKISQILKENSSSLENSLQNSAHS